MSKRLLVVDDDGGILEMLYMVLDKAGYTVDTAPDGAQALVKVHENKPDLIVTDLVMPNMEGFEFLRKLQEGEARGIPVIVMTAKRIDPGALLNEPNVKEYLPKPVKLAKLEAAIFRIVSGQKTF